MSLALIGNLLLRWTCTCCASTFVVCSICSLFTSSSVSVKIYFLLVANCMAVRFSRRCFLLCFLGRWKGLTQKKISEFFCQLHIWLKYSLTLGPFLVVITNSSSAENANIQAYWRHQWTCIHQVMNVTHAIELQYKNDLQIHGQWRENKS